MQIFHPDDTGDAPWPRPVAQAEPSKELLNRAHAGWERFLDTFEEASDE
ncbi:hypothetical protein ABZ743_03900 [Streptomyces sp. NPDC006662]